jgi:hypothetical protein
MGGSESVGNSALVFTLPLYSRRFEVMTILRIRRQLRLEDDFQQGMATVPSLVDQLVY